MLIATRPEDDEQIMRAARLAGAHDTLAGLSHGYDTLLTRLFSVPRPGPPPGRGRRRHRNPAAVGSVPGAAGTTLSGGQWQRVAIARAMLRGDADLLILDEPSSGLDAEAENDIHARLSSLRAGRTSLLISHRLSAVRDADDIVVLRDGRVVERATHGQLIRSGGDYAGLFRTQASGYQLDPPVR